MPWIFLIGLFLVSCGAERRLPVSSSQDVEYRHCEQLASKKKFDEAVECLEVFKSRFPSGQKAAEADIMIADNYFRQKEYLVAANAYREFAKEYPYHAKADYAYYKSGQAYLKEIPKAIDRDQDYLDSAIESFEMITKYLPNSAYGGLASGALKQALLTQAKKSYYVGRFYYKYGEYLAAIPRFEEIVVDYSGLGLDEKSFYYLILASRKTGQSEKAQRVLQVFKEAYPQSPYVKKARGIVHES